MGEGVAVGSVVGVAVGCGVAVGGVVAVGSGTGVALGVACPPQLVRTTATINKPMRIDVILDMESLLLY